MERNIGTEARNIGIQNACGKIVVTIDDDIFGLSRENIAVLTRRFGENPRLAALCFKVTDYYSGAVCNWCHPYAEEKFVDRDFLTTEITEGAVAFRRDVIFQVGMYPEKFFISHEGSDLAARILDQGYEIRYSPDIVVRHNYAKEGREHWRRYFYDTRNAFWLTFRNYRLKYGTVFLVKRTGIMLVYALRDGYFRYWLKAVGASLRDIPLMLRGRQPISKETERKIREINRNRPSLMYYVKKRLKQKQVKI